MAVKVRRATKDDTSSVKDLIVSLHKVSPYKGVDHSAKDIESFIGVMSGDSGILQVAEVDGKVVGVIGGVVYPYFCNFDYTLATETTFYVAPEFRNTKAGPLLLEQFEKIAAQLGATFVLLGKITSPDMASELRTARKGYSSAEVHFIKRVEK